ncbi:hypothetical protein [Nocardiopsis eucommiae]|uniref:hypothetical protein n=1 Tax=Nocardiopsis eucommiae TaxID=2831970 RepID=UPI003D735CD4
MYPSPPSGPNQPYGQGQPPQHQQQGGYGYPQQPMPHGPGPGHPYGGAPGAPIPPPHFHGAPGVPDAMPGQATTVRVLMFIGGPVGILFGLLLGALVLFGVGLGAAAGSSPEVDSAEMAGMIGVFGALGAVVALIPLVYGIVSTTLAAKMGKRSKGVYWGVVVFNIVAALVLVLNVVASIVMEESPSSLIPLAFHATMTGLMFAPRVRQFYGA